MKQLLIAGTTALVVLSVGCAADDPNKRLSLIHI